jgi:hypothetical protein
MRRLVLLSLVVLAGVTAEAQKQRYSQYSPAAAPAASYTLQLHVTRSFITDTGNLRLVGILNRKGVELADGISPNIPSNPSASGYGVPARLLLPGNYAARSLADRTEKDGSVIRQYDVLLANGQHQAFTVVGLSE